MKRMTMLLGAYALPVVLVFLPDQPFHGYLDAGSGSIILQAVIGVVVGALVAIKIFWHQIKAFFVGLFSRSRGGNGADTGDN